MKQNRVLASCVASMTFVMLSSAALAQQAGLKEKLIGAWSMVSVENTAPDGKKATPFGANPIGTVIYDASGQYSVVFTSPDRPKWKSRNRNEASQDDIKSAWSVDPDGKTVTLGIKTALVPNNEGRESKVTIVISGDELRLTENAPNGGTNQIVERRIK